MWVGEYGGRGGAVSVLLQRLSHLPVVPVVLKALVYDEKRGTYSVGMWNTQCQPYVCRTCGVRM